jgi:hypothetical protein
LRHDEGGFSQLTLEANGEVHRVGINGAERLKKLAGRLPKENLFGNVAQAWIYDPIALIPDRSNRMGWVFFDADTFAGETDAMQSEVGRRVWAMIQLLSPVPLLPTWEQVIRETTKEAVRDMQGSPYPALGRISTVLVQLPADFGDRVSQFVKTGSIGISPPMKATVAVEAAAI